MDTLQFAIWAVSLAGLVGVAFALHKSDRLAIRLGALLGFGAFYLAVLVWGPVDEAWFGVTTVSLLVIAFRLRTTPSSDDKKNDRPTGA